MKKVLVIGSGSVTKKHIKNLLLLGYEPILSENNRLKNYFKSKTNISYTNDFKKIRKKKKFYLCLYAIALINILNI